MPKKTKISNVITRTVVAFLLDRSGSMASCRDATIEAFNGYRQGLQENPTKGEKIEFTFLQFDSVSLDKVCVAQPIADVAALTRETYVPRAGTPLIDASVKTIRAVEAAVNEDSKAKVVVCIQTDGEENQSNEHTWEELHALVKEKTSAGWQFNFMGAGIDAYAQGARMGISSGATMSYDHRDRGATKAAFAASANNTRMFSRGARTDTTYSVDQRRSAGDKFAPPNLGGTSPVTGGVAVKPPLDLTSPQPTVTTRATSAKRRTAVPDFTI